MSNCYIIAGCNGSGKTTASYALLPGILNCVEFVNADNIASGISPFNMEKVAFEAGRIMLRRIHRLMEEKVDFAFETTLAARSYVPLVRRARDDGYKIVLVYFWLSSVKEAQERVALRVSKGGHDIPLAVIEQRYYRSIGNLIQLYVPVCDFWMVVDNSRAYPKLIVQGGLTTTEMVYNGDIWREIKCIGGCLWMR